MPHIAPLASALAEAWFAALWQGLVLAGVVALSLRLLPGLSAGRRSLIWVAVLVLLAGTHFSCRIYGDHHGILSGKAGQQTAWLLDARWSLALAAVWALGSSLQAVRLLLGLVRVVRLRRQTTSISGSQGNVAYESPAITRPCVVGFLWPRIVLPEGLAEQLSAAELQQVLLHEAEHIRRGDHWLNLMQKLMLVLFPLNPAMFLVERRLCAERELACDDRVMQVTGARKAYAVCLARIAEHRLTGHCAALAVGAWDRRPELVRRVERILRTDPKELHGWRARTVSGLVMAGTIGGATILIQTPRLVRFTSAGTETAPLTQPGQTARPATWPVAAVSSYVSAETVSYRTPVRTVVGSQGKSRRVRTRHLRPLSPTRLLATADPDFAFTPLQPMQVAWQANLTSGDRGPSVRQRPATLLPAVVYLVPTPEGWLVLQL